MQERQNPTMKVVGHYVEPVNVRFQADNIKVAGDGLISGCNWKGRFCSYRMYQYEEGMVIVNP